MRRATEKFTLMPIADTSDRFSDFAPYVASINDAGTVAFQATLREVAAGPESSPDPANLRTELNRPLTG